MLDRIASQFGQASRRGLPLRGTLPLKIRRVGHGIGTEPRAIATLVLTVMKPLLVTRVHALSDT
jgi:hypothetical protein